jgi:hypothetical protein
MSGHDYRGGLGFGGAVGLGAAAVLIITVVAIGRALARQLTSAMSVVIVFAEVALCTVLGAAAIGVLGLLIYRGQLARLHLAERRAQLEQHGPSWRAEVLEHAEAAEFPRPGPPAIQGERPGSLPGRHLTAVHEPGDGEGAS